MTENKALTKQQILEAFRGLLLELEASNEISHCEFKCINEFNDVPTRFWHEQISNGWRTLTLTIRWNNES